MLSPADIAPETFRPLRRAEYELLVEAGFFDDEKLELLRGCLVTMSRQTPRHASCVRQVGNHLSFVLRGRAQVRQHSPLALGDDSEPESDVAVIPAGDYRRAHPQTAWLVVEVADSSLNKDRGPKAEVYAANGIEEYWLVDLQNDRVWVHRDPSPDGYARVEAAGAEDTLAPLRFPDVQIPLGELLG